MRIPFDGLGRSRSGSRRESTRSTKNRSSEKTQSRRTRQSERAAPAARRKPAVRSQRNNPPVLTRSSMTDWPVAGRKKRSSGLPRRRYDVALSSPGAEIRLPSIPRLNLGWRLLSFVLVAGLVVVLYQLWTAPQFQVQAAEVSGLQRLSEQDINSVLDLNGQPIFALDAAVLAQKLETAFPEFEQVSVEVGLPNSIQVEVNERVPVLIWNQDGRPELVDRTGMAFPARRSGTLNIDIRVEALDAPPSLEPEAEVMDMAGEQAAQRTQLLRAHRLLTPEMVSAALALSGRLPEGAVLSFDNQRGFGWQDPAGWQVNFGQPQDVESKLIVYQAIVEELQQQGVVPELISVEFVHAPYYRLAQ